MESESEQDNLEELPLSKSELKRQMRARQELGEQLLDLSPAQLEQLDLPSNLRLALDRAKHITKREGLRRELQYIGKLMRHIDVAPIETFFENLNAARQSVTDSFHEVEAWRDKLLQDPDALTELISQHPSEDYQTLRQLILNYRKTKKESQRKKYFRALFQELKTILQFED